MRVTRDITSVVLIRPFKFKNHILKSKLTLKHLKSKFPLSLSYKDKLELFPLIFHPNIPSRI